MLCIITVRSIPGDDNDHFNVPFVSLNSYVPQVVGTWEKVVEQCINGRLQPLVLFYQAQ